jgi:hypothetical protein
MATWADEDQHRRCSRWESVRRIRDALPNPCDQSAGPRVGQIRQRQHAEAVAEARHAASRLQQFPGFWITLVTIGIARAIWIASTNRTLGRGGAGFLFAWFLPF